MNTSIIVGVIITLTTSGEIDIEKQVFPSMKRCTEIQMNYYIGQDRLREQMEKEPLRFKTVAGTFRCLTLKAKG